MLYENAEISSACPICGTQLGHILHHMTARQAAQHFVLREVDVERHERLVAAIERIWQGEGADWIRCENCGFTHAEPHVSGDVEFYSLAYERTHYPTDKWEFRRSIRAISTHPDLTGIGLENVRVLEIGAGEGNFVSQLLRIGVRPQNIICTDYSEFGRAQIEKMGVRCYAKDIFELKSTDIPEPIHLVCLFQVLEHVDNPAGLMDKLDSICAPEALMLVSVPSERRMEFNELNGSLLDMPPNHVGRWSRRAFEILASRSGWALEAHEVEPEGPRQKLLQYMKYRYMRRMQDSGSYANRVERMGRGELRTFLRMLLAAGYTFTHMPAALRLAFGTELGNSQWVQMSRRQAVVPKSSY